MDDTVLIQKYIFVYVSDLWWVLQGRIISEKALVFYLLENGAKLDVRDKKGNLPIHYAKDEVVKQMILSRWYF